MYKMNLGKYGIVEINSVGGEKSGVITYKGSTKYFAFYVDPNVNFQQNIHEYEKQLISDLEKCQK